MIEGSGSISLTTIREAQKHMDSTDPDPQHYPYLCNVRVGRGGAGRPEHWHDDVQRPSAGDGAVLQLGQVLLLSKPLADFLEKQLLLYNLYYSDKHTKKNLMLYIINTDHRVTIYDITKIYSDTQNWSKKINVIIFFQRMPYTVPNKKKWHLFIFLSPLDNDDIYGHG